MREEEHSSGSTLFTFLLGGIVGAGLALLFAPQAGSETRQKLKDFTEDLKGKTTDYMQQARERSDSLIEEGKDYYDEKKSVLRSAVEAGKKAYEKEKEKISKT